MNASSRNNADGRPNNDHQPCPDSDDYLLNSKGGDRLGNGKEAQRKVDEGRHEKTPTMRELATDLMQQYDHSRMQLTPQEHQWAVAIKKAVEDLPDLDDLTDFMCGMFAIQTQGNVVDAVERAYRLQEHKKENKIMDNYDDGLRNLPFEAHFLSIDYNLQTGGYILAMDFTKTNAKTFRNPEETAYYNRRSFYCTQMAFCDFEALRTGLIILVECQGYKLISGQSFDLAIFKAMWKGALSSPKKISQVKFFSPPAMFKVMLSLIKATLPKDISSKFQVISECPMGRLDRLYSIPTPEIAKARLQERMRGLIVKRYANESAFSLSHPPAGTAPSDGK